MNMLEFLQQQAELMKMTKAEFGELVHSSNQADVDAAMAALEMAGGYDNLED